MSDAGGRPREERAFFFLKPEDAGHPETPSASDACLYVLDTWLGDDLIRAHPGLLVTTPLKESLESLPAPTGFRIVEARTRPSVFLQEQRPGLRLPLFWALQIYGQAGLHELGLTADHSLVVSQRALDQFVQHSIRHATLAQYAHGTERREGGSRKVH